VRAVAVEDQEGTRHWYLTNGGREVLSPREIAEAYRLRWEAELLFNQLKSDAGLNALLAWCASAVASFIYAKVVALGLTRLFQLSVEEQVGRFATTQLVLILALSRSAPLRLSFFLMWRGVTLPQLEERILLIARIVAKSCIQRRERAKRKRFQSIGIGDP
jgi:hypothetical protein